VKPRRTRSRTLAADLSSAVDRTLAAVRSGEYPLTQYQRDPVRYVRERLRVKVIMPHQAAILEALAAGIAGLAHPRVAVRSGQKSGKTATAVWAALWFYECFAGAQVLMTAAIEAQTRGVLWKELGDTKRRAETEGAHIDGDLSRAPGTGLVSSDGSRTIRGVSGRDIEALAGVSGRQLMIVDEASHLPEEKAQVFAGNQMGGGGAILLISNPTANAGPFYEAFHAMGAWWQKFHVNCLEVAKWQVANDVRIPFTTSAEKIEEAREMYGEDSPFWYWRVLGEFLRNETGRVNPMIRIEAAIARWADASDAGPLAIGYDPAGDGIDADEHGFAAVRGSKCMAMHRRRGLREEDALHELYAFMSDHRRGGEPVWIIVDAEGPIGSMYYGRLRAESERRKIHDPANAFDVQPVRASSRFVRDKRKFDRVRDELVWVLSQWLVDGAIPNDPKLQAELYAPVWEPNANGKLQCTRKAELRDKLGRSPDSFDALALAVWPRRNHAGEAPAPAAPPQDAQDAAFMYDQQAAGDVWWPDGGG
jgi:hypothetical protein